MIVAVVRNHLKGENHMAKNKNKEMKKQLNEIVRNASNPWEMQQNVQQYLQTTGVNYKSPVQTNPSDGAAMKMPDYDISKLMDKLGDKMPPGMKQMMDQFMPVIPTKEAMQDPNFKKEMKKKMKNFRSVFQSPYE